MTTRSPSDTFPHWIYDNSPISSKWTRISVRVFVYRRSFQLTEHCSARAAVHATSIQAANLALKAIALLYHGVKLCE
jgi:hypothetical protein